MKNNHTQLTRLAAISLCLVLCLSVVPFMAPSASAAHPTHGSGLVVAIGDSLTYNHNYPNYEQYPEQIGLMTGANVLNVGIGGQTTSQMLDRFESDVLSYDPSYVLLMGGINDLGAGVPVEEIISNLDEMKDMALASGAVVFMLTLTPYSNPLADQISEWVMTQAADDVIVVDVCTPLRSGADNRTIDPAYQVDGPHLNPAGLHVLASTVIDAAQARGIWMSATDKTLPKYIWDGEGSDNLASNADNWRRDIGGVITNDVAPADNGIVIFNGTSNKDCTWDIDASAVTLYALSITQEYTGNFTQSPSIDIGIGIGGLFIDGGVTTFTSSGWVNCAGSAYIDSIEPEYLRLNMAGDCKTLRTIDVVMHTLMISGHILSYNTPTTSKGSLIVEPYSSLNLGDEMRVRATGATAGMVNEGHIYGRGTLVIRVTGDPPTFDPGSISCPLTILLTSDTESRTVSMVSDWDGISGPLTLKSDVAHSLILDVGDHTLSCGQLIIMSGAILLGGEGTIRVNDLWDSYDGTWTPEDSTVVLSDGGTVKLAPGQSFNRLEISSGNGRTATWSMTATGAQAPIVTGLRSGSYLWYLDGVEQGEVKADKDGTIALSYESTGLHTLEVKPTSMTAAMDGVAAAVGIVAVLAMLSGLITMVGRLKF